MAVQEDVRLPSNQAVFELALVSELAIRQGALGPAILEQFRRARVTGRYGTAVGCFTHFCVPGECAPLPDGTRSPIDGPVIQMAGTGRGASGTGLAGSLLFHESGKIAMLECHAYGDSWPEELYEFEFVPAGDREGQ